MDAANRGKLEAEKVAKKYQEQCREMNVQIEEEARQVSEAREAYSMAERRVTLAQNECEEIRLALESADRARKAAESDVLEATGRINELSSMLQTTSSQKRKLESDISAMQGDLEELTTEVRAADDRAKKAMSDAVRLTDELRSEQSHTQQVEKMRKVLETQVREMSTKLDEAESAAMKGGKKMLAKLEQRVSRDMFASNG